MSSSKPEVTVPSDFAGDGQLFVRNATGLVREVSRWDALIMNTLGMNVALGAIFLLLQRHIVAGLTAGALK